MIRGRTFAIVVPAIVAGTLVTSPQARAQAADDVELVVARGRPLRVALADSTTVRRVGQTVTATVVDPVYAYDRVVIPAGTQVVGRIAKLENPSRLNRTRAMVSGDFSPHRFIQLEFESIVHDGELLPIHAAAVNGIPRVARQVAAKADDTTEAHGVARAKKEAKSRASAAVAAVKEKVSGTIATVRQPGKGQRLREWAIDRLPYHRQVLRKGMVYDAELQSSVSFGMVSAHPPAPQGTLPAPASILNARLATTLDSAQTPRGTALEAIVTQPVFAEDGRLILPEGTRFTGEVTFAREARRFHRNGQLRFLFERVQPPDQDEAVLPASLHAIDVSEDDRVVLDDEGGAAVHDSKARFVTPAIAVLALRASLEQGEGRGFESGTAGLQPRATSASVGSRHFLGRGVGSFIGFGLIGVAIARISPPLGIAFSAAGAARSVYSNIFGKGQEVHFQANTPIQVQLAPARRDP